jgi:uncharacterized membrane protein
MDNPIFKSASKIVFLLMAIAVVVLTFIGIVDPKDFMMLAGMAFAFYFSNKGETNSGLPYAGK